ncbi:MAG: hypothetical protein BWY69_00716 [Planctomycetes bacterium ADurb.Bin401]|nr:MAG: hypothetical protein BWY69_00716 [Planctomycetes bacterium ADurb.Bin401]
MGRGPEETRTYIVDDLVIVRLKRVLTPAEQQLASTGEDSRGRSLVKQVRTERQKTFGAVASPRQI